MNVAELLLREHINKFLDHKAAYEEAKEKYFALTDLDYENLKRCSDLEKRYLEEKSEYEFHARVLAEFVLMNKDNIRIEEEGERNGRNSRNGIDAV